MENTFNVPREKTSQQHEYLKENIYRQRVRQEPRWNMAVRDGATSFIIIKHACLTIHSWRKYWTLALQRCEEAAMCESHYLLRAKRIADITRRETIIRLKSLNLTKTVILWEFLRGNMGRFWGERSPREKILYLAGFHFLSPQMKQVLKGYSKNLTWTLKEICNMHISRFCLEPLLFKSTNPPYDKSCDNQETFMSHLLYLVKKDNDCGCRTDRLWRQWISQGSICTEPLSNNINRNVGAANKIA